MLEFGSREEVRPASGVVEVKDMKVGFDLLVGPFGLSVHLGVVSSGESYIVLEEPSKFSCQC